MKDMVVKKMCRKAQGDIASKLVQKKHAKNGERIESNAYTVTVQALSALGKTVTKGALSMAVTCEYTNRHGNSSSPVSIVASLLPSSASALTSLPSSLSSESTSNDNTAGLNVMLAAAALEGNRGLSAATLTSAGRTSLSPSFDEVNAVAIEQGGTDPSDFFRIEESNDESIMAAEETVFS